MKVLFLLVVDVTSNQPSLTSVYIKVALDCSFPPAPRLCAAARLLSAEQGQTVRCDKIKTCGDKKSKHEMLREVWRHVCSGGRVVSCRISSHGSVNRF